MASRVNFTVTDYTRESSNFAVNGISISSANYDAQITAAIALSAAIEGLIIGQLAKREVVASIAFPQTSTPTDPFAQREMKWLVVYQDDTTSKLQSLEIACPDLALLTPNTDLLNLASTEGAAFVTAFESFVRSSDGNTVSVVSARLVGRNL